MPLPKYGQLNSEVYEPSEDTFLLLDAVDDLDCQKISLALEIGPGSGVVSTHLAKKTPNGLVLAADINPLAAKATADTFNLNKCTGEVLVDDLGKHLRRSVFDLIVFNPPYVPSDDKTESYDTIDRAWAGGPDGSAVISQFLKLFTSLLAPGGSCLLLLEKRNKPSLLLEGFDAELMRSSKIPGEHLFVYRLSGSTGTTYRVTK